MSLPSINWKGIVVAAGLIGSSAALWFTRTDSGSVHAIDVAELVAACHDCLQELAGDGATSVVFTSTGWESDNTVTNAWGGYQSFTLSCPAYSTYNGTYVFQGRSYDPQPTYANFYPTALIGGAIDTYWNGTYYLFDCGPGGAVDNQANSYAPYQQNGSWFLASPYYLGPNIIARTARWNDIASGNFVYVTSSGSFTTSINSVTYPTGGVSRIRYYSPHTLVTYTNTILPISDQNTIAGIRSSVLLALKWGHRYDIYNTYYDQFPCFIGPIAAGATYDGVSNFPRVVSGTAVGYNTMGTMLDWGSTYTNWTQDGHSITNYATVTNHFPYNLIVTYTNGIQETITGTDDGYGSFYGAGANGEWYWSLLYTYTEYAPTTPSDAVNYWESFSAPPCTLLPYDAYGSNLVGYADVYATPTNSTQISISTNIIACPNESMFIKTNELAWHYSALYRLRDEAVIPTWKSNFVFTILSGNYASPTICWNQANTAFTLALANQSVSSYGAIFRTNAFSYPPSTQITTVLNGPNSYSVNMTICWGSYTTTGISTNNSSTAEWYGNVAPYGTFKQYGCPISVPNVWKLTDTQSVSGSTNITTVFNSYVFPPLSDAVPGTSKGFSVTVQPVLRWTQRACNASTFDGRYP